MNTPAAFFSDGRSLDDWLSPILVKELRQGMRARVFILSFLLLQVFLVVLTLGNVAAQDDRNTLNSQNEFFWVIIGFVLLVLMPLRGLVAVSQEVKNHTMETILLTRLTAWRVVFGKWSALFAQSLLLVSAVLPYVVLRYFIGGQDVVADFKWIFFLLWLSGILNAAGIAVSGLGNPVIRTIVLVGVVLLTASSAGNIFSTGFSHGGAWEIIGWLFLFGLFIPALLFELTASGIAPVSENHAIRRRLLALLFFILAMGMCWVTHGDFRPGIVIPLIILTGICYYELAEKPRLLPRMIQSLAKRGWLGKIGGLFLLPGWPSALLFSLAIIPAAMGMGDFFIPPNSGIGWLLPIFAVLGSVLMPIFICHLFWPKMNQVVLMIVLYNIALTVIGEICAGFELLTHSRVDLALAFLPGLPSFYVVQNTGTGISSPDAMWYLIGNGTVLSVLILGLFVQSRAYFGGLLALFRSTNK